MVSRPSCSYPGVSIYSLFRFSPAHFKEIIPNFEIFKRFKCYHLNGKKIIKFDNSLYRPNILVSENRDVYIVISNLLALYILSVAEYCSKELILIIESLIFPNMSNLSLSGKKRKLGEFSNILGDFHINELIKSKNIILELKDKAIMLRDFYWNIEEEQIYLYCPLINDTIKDCNSGIESVGKLLGECSHMVKYHRKNMEV